MHKVLHETVLAIVLVFVVCVQSAQPQNKAPAKPTASVSGSITLNGRGVAGVVVVLRTQNDTRGFSKRAVTDVDGNYQIVGVNEGSYFVRPIAPALVVSDTETSAEPGKIVVITSGETASNIDFELRPGAVVTGKVTDSEGRVVVEEMVSLEPVTESNPRVRRAPAFRTDDRGIYRLFGVPPGRYRVAVGTAGEYSAFSAIMMGGRPYRLTYYPNVTDSSKATVVEVSEGAELTDINITVGLRMDTYTIKGKVVDKESGKPIANVRFGLAMMSNGTVQNYLPIRSTSNAKGEFTVSNVPPGKYSVLLQTDGNSPLFAELTVVEVVDQDVSDVVVNVSAGASLSGTVVLENITDKRIQAQLSKMQVHAYVRTTEQQSMSWRTAPIGSDGNFLIQGLPPGSVYINMLSFLDRQPAKNFVVLFLEKDGVRQPQGIELKQGDRLSGVRVVVGYGTGIVRGLVRTNEGSLPQGSRLFVLLTRVTEPQPLRSAPLDARGHFSLETVPAGTYTLTVSGNLGRGMRAPIPPQQLVVNEGAITETTVIINLSNEELKPRP